MRNIQVGITDHLDSEVQAMLMAMYSRSYVPIATRIPSSEESVQEHKEKLGRFYIGYNHKSVGQLGGTTIWLEGISQLAAKAVEHNSLFNGQESSTRYINFAEQPMIVPHEDIGIWQENFRAFYIKALPLVVEKIKAEYPYTSQPEGTSETTWSNTIKARAFDICRGFLPAGCTTNVAFSGTFDLINDHFGEMLKHPCKEMQDIAVDAVEGLSEKYKYAAMTLEKHQERNAHVTDEFFYQSDTKNFMLTDSIAVSQEAAVNLDLTARRKFDKVPSFYSDKIRVCLQGQIDFGSYRDLHRHRNGRINMEVLGIDRGFEHFYSSNLPVELHEELTTLLNTYEQWYNQSDLSSFDKQYSTPMGYKVGVVYTCDLNQALYIFELRSSKTVHQTLRKLVQSWVTDFRDAASDVLIHADMDEDNFTLKRGTQTFSEVV